ncbi:unannotated protein [freshwater metagenome]|uniref:Unannotated protein n=1 Tax=freshwater metagenome TaxID=449393 RepID=A0A6J7FAV3_9ZZZZ
MISTERNRIVGYLLASKVLSALAFATIFSGPISGVSPPSPWITSSEPTSAVSDTAVGASPDHSTVAVQEVTAIVSRCPILDALPVTSVLTANCPPSDASKAQVSVVIFATVDARRPGSSPKPTMEA